MAPVLACLLLYYASAGNAGAATQNVHEYSVELDAGFSRIKVAACFSGSPPRYLMAESLDASVVLRQPYLDGIKRPLEPNGTQLPLKGAQAGSCLRYEVDVTHLGGRHERGAGLTGRIGDDLLLDVGLWLWRPETLSEGEDLRIRFTLPDGVAVSVPWHAEGDPGTNTFRTGRSPYDWPALSAFGRFRPVDIDLPGGRVKLVLLGVTPRRPVDKIEGWVREAAASVVAAYGRLPVPNARVIIVPNAQGNRPVPWAFVQRGGIPSLQFLINHRLPDETFRTDDTLFHEFAHLLHPAMFHLDAWFFEGLASYYEHVLRARAGVIAPLDAWRRLHTGFARGRRSQVGTPLNQATERMYRNAGYMRVYWHGAALMMMADYELRRQTQGRHSLDSALAEVARCCLGEPVEWRARDLMALMDTYTGTSVLSDLHDSNEGANDFPLLTTVYDALGLVVRDNEVHFAASAPHAHIRDDIMKPARPPATPDSRP